MPQHGGDWELSGPYRDRPSRANWVSSTVRCWRGKAGAGPWGKQSVAQCVGRDRESISVFLLKEVPKCCWRLLGHHPSWGSIQRGRKLVPPASLCPSASQSPHALVSSLKYIQLILPQRIGVRITEALQIEFLGCGMFLVTVSYHQGAENK